MIPDAAVALRALADLTTATGSLREALIAWPRCAPVALRPPLERLSARLALGAPISYALGVLGQPLGNHADLLTAICRLHLSSGARVSPLLRALADRIAARSETAGRLNAGLAGVKASARLVAVLPVVCLAALPLDRSSLSDPLGVALLGVGLVLAIGGFVWMQRVVPRLDALDDPLADMIELVAAALDCGTPFTTAFELAASGALGSYRVPIDRALRLARLGSRWPVALRLTGDADLVELSRMIEPSLRDGTPLGPALRAWAEARREGASIGVDRAMKRAPVRMILPLTLCVLPSFVLLGLGPFIRELAGFV